MINYFDISVKKKLTKFNIKKELKLNGYNEYDLAVYYISGFTKFNKAIKSDLRSDDKNNSLVVKIKNGELLISDFGLKTGMSIYNYIIYKYNLTGKNAFYKALDKIRFDFNLKNIEPLHTEFANSKNTIPLKHNKQIKENTLPVKIEVRRSSKWSNKDIKYWKSYGISISKLEEKGIKPLNTFWITNFDKDGIRKRFDVGNDLCYVYPFYRNIEGNFMYKIYLPLGYKGNSNIKWISNVNKKVIPNIQYIQKSSDLLIIQSSYKDIMLMEELNSSLDVISFNGEGMWCDYDAWLDLKKRFKHIVYFANNDFLKNPNPGLEFARKHSLKYKIPFVSTFNHTTSDISDYYKLYGKEKTILFLDKILEYINLIK